MPRKGIDKLALLVVLGAAVLVVIAAAGTGPAYSHDNPAEPAATALAPATASTSSDLTAASNVEGYQWSGSRPPAERYLWSQ